jgi:hypothetical protein
VHLGPGSALFGVKVKADALRELFAEAATASTAA